MISCALIGLGQIGFEYDLNRKSNFERLTHTTTILSLPELNMKFAIEIDSNKRKVFEAVTGISCFESVSKLPGGILENGIDLLVIASPAAAHLENVIEGLKLNPKAILLEKPLALDVLNAAEIIKIAAENSVKLFINYQRNYLPVFQQMRDLISSRQGFEEYSLVGWLQGDLLNSGSHLIALVDCLFPSYLENLICVDKFGMHFESFGRVLDLNLSKVDQLAASKFSLEITTSKENFRYDSQLEAINVSYPGNDKVYAGQTSLQPPSERLQTNEYDCLHFVYAEILKFLKKESYYSYTGEDALFVMKFIQDLRGQSLGEL